MHSQFNKIVSELRSAIVVVGFSRLAALGFDSELSEMLHHAAGWVHSTGYATI
jgi:hypothetical protein